MVRGKHSGLFTLLACVLLLLSASYVSAAEKQVQVMLTFDTERNDDVEALQRLQVDVPATYFITGRFAESKADFVASLSAKGNTIGSHSYSHPHLPALDPKALAEELGRGKKTLEAATGKKVTWFRAPYMELNDAALRELMKLGFRYDSSDNERWQRQDVLYELPIANFRHDKMIASDYDMINNHRASSAEFEKMLMELYHEKASLGQAVVILLHPAIAAQYPDAFRSFVSRVRKLGGKFVTVDSYVDSLNARKSARNAVGVDFSTGRHNPQQLAADLSGMGVTDVFLMARDKSGRQWYNPNEGKDLFGTSLGLLKKKGMKVHAWIPLLLDANALKQHPSWAMTDQGGHFSKEWLSPLHPEVQKHAERTVKELLRNYDLDGIHLDQITYPGIEVDFSGQMVKKFSRHERLKAIPSNEELMNRMFTEWSNWRASTLTSFVSGIRRVVRREAGGRVELSAAIPADVAASYKSAEKNGIDVSRLSRQLDLIVPVVENAAKDHATDAIGNWLFSMRHRSFSKPLLIRFQAPGAGDSVQTFAQALHAGKSGGDGIGIVPYLSVVRRAAGGVNMAAENVEILRKAFSGKEFFVPPQLARVSLIDFPADPHLIPAFMLLVLFVTNIAVISAFVIKSNDPDFREAMVSDAHFRSWQEISAGLEEGFLDGPAAEQVARMLRQFDARRIQQNRIVLVLDTVCRSSNPFPELYGIIPHSQEWKALILKYVHEACLLGYVSIDEDKVLLAPEGRMVLNAAIERNFDRGFWIFAEQRLHETVSIDCPACGAENLTHFFWQTYECKECGKQSRLGQSPAIHVRNAPQNASLAGRIDFF